MVYDAIDNQQKETEATYLGTSQKWETASYELNDAYFANRLGGNDLRVTVNSKSIGSGNGNVLIGGVRIYKYSAKNPVQVSSVKTTELGNIFGNGQEKKFDVSYVNYSEETKSFDVVYKAVDSYRAEVWQKSDKITLNSNETKTVEITAEITKYGLYNLEVYIYGDGYSYCETVPFSFVNTCEDGGKNNNFGYNVHFTWNGYDPYEGVEVIKKSNAGYIRNSLQWHLIDAQSSPKFTYSIPPLYQNIIDALSGTGIGIQMLLTYGNMKYEGTSLHTIPTTEEAVKGYTGYAKFLIEELKRQNVNIRSYEIWNEPNLTVFNVGNATAAQYGNLSLETAKAIRSVDENAQIGAMALADFASESSVNFFTEAMETGVGDAIDAITLHPYSHSFIPEMGYIERIKQLREIYREHTGRTPVIDNTEIGYTAFHNELTATALEQAKLNIRTYIYYNAHELGASFTFYDLSNDGANKAYAEANFGHVASSIPNTVKVNYAAKESFVADANLNKVLQNAQVEKTIYEEDGTYAYIFRREKDNAAVMPIWTSAEEPKIISFKCSAPQLKVIDFYGNEEVVCGKDGVYSLIISDVVQYIEGDLNDVSVTDNPIEFEKVSFETSAGSVLALNPKKCNAEDLVCEVVTPENIEVVSTTDAFAAGSKQRVRLSDIEGLETGVRLKLKDGEKTAFIYDFSIKTISPIECSISAVPLSEDDISRWQFNLRIKNNISNTPISGKVVINSPSEIASSLEKVEFDTIPGETTGLVEFYSGKLPRLGIYPIDYTVYTNDGKEYSFSKTVDFTIARYAKSKPNIDALIDENEWDKTATLYSDSAQQIYLSPGYSWAGVKDLSAKTIIQYDNKNLYMALDVTDDIHYAADTGVNIWKNDSVQFGVVFEQRAHDEFVGGTFTEISVSDTPEGPTVWRHASENNDLDLTRVDAAELAVKRDGVHTYYELMIPWEEITVKEIDFDDVTQIGFSMLVNDNDGVGRKGWIEYASGIGKSKDTSLFTFLNVIK